MSGTRKSSILLLVAVMPVPLAAWGPATAKAAEPDPLDCFNVVWDKPAESPKEDASMPIGNGDIGMNVSVEATGDVVLLLSKTDAWSENQELLKLGRVRLKLTPNPFVAGDGSFRQTLRLRQGEIIIAGGKGDKAVALVVWVDANKPVIRVEVESASPVALAAVLDPWRTKPDSNPGSSGFRHYYVKPAAADTVYEGWKNRVVWYYRNAKSIWPVNLTTQGLESWIPKAADPLLNRTFGGCIEGEGLVRKDAVTLESAEARKRFTVSIHPLCAQTEKIEEWLDRLDQSARAHATSRLEQDKAAHRAWWNEFWSRSWIRATGSPQAETVTRGYTLQRWINACGGRGVHAIKFNGSIFTVGWNGGDPDGRRWGGCYWWQNTRLAYWPMLASGDFDLMMPLSRTYLDTLPLAEHRTKTWYGHGGAFFPETMHFWGLHNDGDYGGKHEPIGVVRSGWIGREYTSSPELMAMLLDYYTFTGDDSFLRDKLLPACDSLLEFFDKHYKTDENGHIRMYPGQALETWQDAANPTPDVAGLHWVLRGLLSIPADKTGAERRAFWTKLDAKVPPIPMTEEDGDTYILPAGEVFSGRGNSENAELYTVFPFRFYGVGKPDLDIGRVTYERRGIKAGGCWYQDDVQAAFLGLTEEARDMVIRRAGAKQSGSRFPAFWTAGNDYMPDQDHGGNLLMALQCMLLQADDGKIQVLPAWPPEWDVEFKLHAPQRTTVEGTVRGGKLVALNVTPESRRDDVVVLPPYQDPTAFVAEPTSGEVPLPVRFDGTAAGKVLGKITSYQWDFGDGATAGGATAAHTYEKAGKYKVSLQLKDDQGKTVASRSTIVVTPVDAVPPTISTVTAPGRADRCNVTFSEPVLMEDAETASNYAITPDVKVVAASIGKDGRTVTLTTSSLSLGVEYALTAKNVRDRARKPNAIAPDARKAFRYSGLYGRWKLDDGKGRTAADTSGNKLRGALQGGAGWSAADGRVSVSFDGGKDSAIEIPGSKEALVLPFTISFRVNPAAQKSATLFAGGGDKPFSMLFLAEQMLDALDVDVWEEREEYLGVVMEEDGAIQLLSGRGQREGSREDAPKSVTLEVGQWQHVVLTFDEQKAVCYVDGKEKATRAVKALLARQSDPSFRLGRVVQIGRLFRGLLSDVRIYRKALSAAEVQAVMKEGDAATPSVRDENVARPPAGVRIAIDGNSWSVWPQLLIPRTASAIVLINVPLCRTLRGYLESSATQSGGPAASSQRNRGCRLAGHSDEEANGKQEWASARPEQSRRALGTDRRISDQHTQSAHGWFQAEATSTLPPSTVHALLLLAPLAEASFMRAFVWDAEDDFSLGDLR